MRSIRIAAYALLPVAFFWTCSCHSLENSSQPSIRFLELPPAHVGGEVSLEPVAGKVASPRPGDRIVLYTNDEGRWWVQPFANKPFTDIASDGSWRSRIHLGQQYAAFLVSGAYHPPPNLTALPVPGGAITAVEKADGTPYVPKIIKFSGYDWEVRKISSIRGGKLNAYSASNAWTDSSGFLHLRVTGENQDWECAEVGLTTSLGEGSYSFTIRDLSHLDRAAVVTIYSWEPGIRFHREFDVEISRWGRPSSHNAQYVIQPYWEPSNVSRFELPGGRSTFYIKWEPGRLSFKTLGQSGKLISSHVAASGVPTPGGEAMHLSLYAFGNSPVPMRQGAEIVVEKFSFLP